MNIGAIILIILGIILGGGTTLAMVVLAIVTFGQKVYRKVKYGISLYD